MSMKYRHFGNTDLKVSEIGLGCNKLGNSLFDKSKEKDNIKLVHQAHELGINIFDLSPSYNYGDTEKMIGKAFKGNRQHVIYSTKVGRLPSSLAKYAKKMMPIAGVLRPFISPFKKSLKKASKSQFDFSENQINTSLQKSMLQLQTDYIDLFLLHNPCIDILQKGDVFEVLEKLKKEGHIRYYGVSIDTAEEAKLAMQYPVSALQIPFNIIQQETAFNIFSHINPQKNPGIMVKTPFLRGLLSSKKLIREEYFTDKMVNQIKLKNAEFDFLTNNRNLNHIALQFVLQHSQVSTALCGTTSIHHLKDNIKHDSMPPFSQTELEKIKLIQEKYPF